MQSRKYSPCLSSPCILLSMTSEDSGSKCCFPDLNVSSQHKHIIQNPWKHGFHLTYTAFCCLSPAFVWFQAWYCIKHWKQMECGLWLKGTRAKVTSCRVSANGWSGINIHRQMGRMCPLGESSLWLFESQLSGVNVSAQPQGRGDFLRFGVPIPPR